MGNEKPNFLIFHHSSTPTLLPLDLHAGYDDFVVGISLPDYIFRQAVNFSERIERHHQRFFHHDAASLL